MRLANPGFWLLTAFLLQAGEASAVEDNAVRQTAGAAAQSDDHPGIALNRLKRGSKNRSGKNLFGTKSWGDEVPQAQAKPASVDATPPVPAPAAPSGPVALTAPPVPFTYMGKMLDEQSGKLVLYLAKGDVAYTVGEGDVIDATYRVAAITDTELTLIYIPLNIKQILIIGGSNS